MFSQSFSSFSAPVYEAPLFASGHLRFRGKTVIKQRFRAFAPVIHSVPMGFSSGYEVMQYQSAPLMPVYDAPVPYSSPPATYSSPQAMPQAPRKSVPAPPLPQKSPPEPVPSAQIGPPLGPSS
jgi:hypothetical protein